MYVRCLQTSTTIFLCKSALNYSLLFSLYLSLSVSFYVRAYTLHSMNFNLRPLEKVNSTLIMFNECNYVYNLFYVMVIYTSAFSPICIPTFSLPT